MRVPGLTCTALFPCSLVTAKANDRQIGSHFNTPVSHHDNIRPSESKKQKTNKQYKQIHKMRFLNDFVCLVALLLLFVVVVVVVVVVGCCCCCCCCCCFICLGFCFFGGQSFSLLYANASLIHSFILEKFI